MISFIIPTLDEQKLLPTTLRQLVSLAQGRSIEILVVDGGSTDDTVDAARAVPGVRILDSRPGRGRQMNAGARQARGSLLVFLPADTILSADALVELLKADARRAPLAGGFRQCFDRDRPVLRGISALHNLRARLTGVFYGDQVPFVRKELFDAIGGFREDIDMEDVEYGSRLKRRTRPRQLRPTVSTSSRRFDRVGDLRATFEAAWLLFCWVLVRRIPGSAIFFRPVR